MKTSWYSLTSSTTNEMCPRKKNRIQTIKKEYNNLDLYLNSLELLLKFEERPQCNLGQTVFTAGYAAAHLSCLNVILQNGRPAGLSLAQDNKTLRL